MDKDSLSKKLLGTAGWLLAHFVAGVVLLFVLVRVVPSFERIFADFAIQLPVITKVLIRLSWWTCAY